MNICIVGTGYVGLVTGACFAEMGNNVICVDLDKEKIDNLKKGILPIHEPGLEEIVIRNYKQQRLFFTTDLHQAVNESYICFIAVGTPQDKDGSADLSYVLQVAKDIGKAMNDDKIIVIKSTVPVGTYLLVAEEIVNNIITYSYRNIKFGVVSNPEFLKEGNAVKDFMHPDRIIIGTYSPNDEKVLRELFKPFVKTTGNPILVMKNESAELSKYAANAFLATKVSFINEIAILCEKVGADIEEVRQGMGTDERIGNRFLLPGPGYGGSCFPKDVRALINKGLEYNFELKICEAAKIVNDRQKRLVFQKIIDYFNDYPGDKSLSIGIWGLTFKPNTDDIRESPSIDIIQKLINSRFNIKVFDPLGMHETKKIFGNKITYAIDPYDATESVNMLVILTDWNLFKNPDFNIMKRRMTEPIIFDAKNILNTDDALSHGFTYFGIGKKIN